MSQTLAATGADDRLSYLTPDGNPLPYYVRMDLAYDNTVVVGPQGSGFAGYSRTVQGFAYEQPLELFMSYQTDSNVANREIYLFITDQQNNLIMRYGAQAVIPANVTDDISFSRAIATPYASQGIGYFHPMINLVLPPGYHWGVSIINNQIGDATLALNLTRRLFPTGPPIQQQTPGALNILDTSALV